MRKIESRKARPWDSLWPVILRTNPGKTTDVTEEAFTDWKVNQCLRGAPNTQALSLTASVHAQSVMSDSLWPHGLFHTPPPCLPRLLCPWNFSGKNTGVSCHFLLQGIFPTQGLTQVSWFFTPAAPGNPRSLPKDTQRSRQRPSKVTSEGGLKEAFQVEGHFCQSPAEMSTYCHQAWKQASGVARDLLRGGGGAQTPPRTRGKKRKGQPIPIPEGVPVAVQTALQSLHLWIIFPLVYETVRGLY